MTFQKVNKNVQILTFLLCRMNINIEQVKGFDFLGLITDTNLNWKRHSEKMSSACSKRLIFNLIN